MNKEKEKTILTKEREEYLYWYGIWAINLVYSLLFIVAYYIDAMIDFFKATIVVTLLSLIIVTYYRIKKYLGEKNDL